MTADEGEDITTIGTRIVYQNRWMRVREDAIRRRDGSTGIYGVVEKSDFVVIAPLEDGRLHLVLQFRYPVLVRYWEFPQGSWSRRRKPTLWKWPAVNCARRPVSPRPV